MKKFTKVCLIAGGVCVLIGGGITTVAASMGGSLSDLPGLRYSRLGGNIARDVTREIADGITRDITNGIRDGITRDVTDSIRSGIEDIELELEGELDALDDSFDIFDEYDDYRGFTGAVELNAYSKEYARKLDVEVRRGRVVILPDSETDDIVVESESGKKGLSVYSEGDEVKVALGSKTWNKDEDYEMTVYIHVPSDHRFDEVEITVKAQKNYGVNDRNSEGPSVKAESLKAGTLELDADVGAISVIGGDVGVLDVDSDVGAVKYEGNVDGNVDAECSVGAVKIDLAGEKADYNYEIKSRVGSVIVDGESFAGLSSKKNINNGASKKMELECNTGVLEVKFH